MKSTSHLRVLPIALLALLLALASATMPAHAGDTLVVLVRHAEKIDEPGPDPALSEAGRQRAQLIAERLAHAGVDGIYVTALQRTALTAQPLADRLGLAPHVFWPDENGHEAAARALAERINSAHAGDTLLVVGHSNTLPLIVEALTGIATDAIDEGDYDNIFFITRDSEGVTRLLPAKL